MKNLRWDDEAWVKLYIRDPAEWLALSFDASGLLLHLWRKVDRSGAFGIGDVARAEVPELLALAFRIETARMASALEELVRRKFVVVAKREGQQVIMVPDFEPAQSARSTDRFRQQEKRKRDRDEAISSGKRAPSSHDVTRCHTPSRIEERRSDRSDQKEEKRSSPIGEGVQGEPREHDSNPPETTPSMKSHNGPETPARRSVMQPLQAEPTTPHEQPTEPLVLSSQLPEPPKTRGKAKPKVQVPTPEPRTVTLSPAEYAASCAIKNDPDLARICKNIDQLAVDLVNGCPLVDVADVIRGELGPYLRTDKGRANRYTDGNAFLLRNIRKKQAEQSERQASMVQYAKPPPRSVPPPPPLHPMVEAGAREAREMMEQNPNMSLRELLDFGSVGRKHSFDDMAEA